MTYYPFPITNFPSPMDEKECAAAYQELEAALNELNLGWVAAQVADTVRIGKTVEERSPTRRTPLTKIEDYTAPEQLWLLISAIEKAVVDSWEMEREIAIFFTRKTENSPLSTSLIFSSFPRQAEKILEFNSDSLAQRSNSALELKQLLEKLRLEAFSSETSKISFIQPIKSTLGSVVNHDFTTASEQANLFNVYLFSILLEAIKNEGGSVEYKNVAEEAPHALIFRKAPGRIYGTHPYTHILVEFPNKPRLEIHVGVKVQGRSAVLHDCDLLVLNYKEAAACRLLNREPRHSQVMLAIKSHPYTSELKLDFAGAFIGLASDFRYEGGSYFVSNSSSEAVAKLLTIARRKWELNVKPSSSNDVNRLMYSFQTIFKLFKARA